MMVILAALLPFAEADARALQEQIPVQEGLTIVTAIAESRGDYESIKTVTAVTDAEVHVAYAAELANGRKVEAGRKVLRSDLLTAREYRPEFVSEQNMAHPGTTALGVSKAVLEELLTKGETAFTGQTRTSGGVRKVTGPINRVGIVKYPMLVNDRQMLSFMTNERLDELIEALKVHAMQQAAGAGATTP